MKTININVVLTFDGKITDDDEILEVLRNTKEAILNKGRNGCISPEYNENVSLVEVSVEEFFSKNKLTERV
jgi:hypothetical protein